MAETTCPVFEPTAEEFVNFISYVEKIEKSIDLNKIGICKIVVPKECLSSKPLDIRNVDIKIKNPLKQSAYNQTQNIHGIFNVILYEHAQQYSLQQFIQYSNKYPNEKTDPAETVRNFWRSILYGNKPLYGADMSGSLFNKQNWSFDKINDPLRLIKKKIIGVNTPMLYVGMWKSMFAYHVEDLDLYSMNFLHYGSPKSWYSIPPESRGKFEYLIKASFVEEFQNCPEFLRHKTVMVSPKQLKANGIQYTTVLQKENELVITFPGGYHAGFNHGFNIAEATNFATKRWFDIGKKSNICMCSNENAYFEVSVLEAMYYQKVVKSMTGDVKASLPSHPTAFCVNEQSVMFSPSRGMLTKPNHSHQPTTEPYDVHCYCINDTLFDTESNLATSISSSKFTSMMISHCQECYQLYHSKCCPNDMKIDTVSDNLNSSTINKFTLFQSIRCRICKIIREERKRKIIEEMPEQIVTFLNRNHDIISKSPEIVKAVSNKEKKMKIQEGHSPQQVQSLKTNTIVPSEVKKNEEKNIIPQSKSEIEKKVKVVVNDPISTGWSDSQLIPLAKIDKIESSIPSKIDRTESIALTPVPHKKSIHEIYQKNHRKTILLDDNASSSIRKVDESDLNNFIFSISSNKNKKIHKNPYRPSLIKSSSSQSTGKITTSLKASPSPSKLIKNDKMNLHPKSIVSHGIEPSSSNSISSANNRPFPHSPIIHHHQGSNKDSQSICQLSPDSVALSIGTATMLKIDCPSSTHPHDSSNSMHYTSIHA